MPKEQSKLRAKRVGMLTQMECTELLLGCLDVDNTRGLSL